MRMVKRRNSRRAGFEKCPIPWKELMKIPNNLYSSRNLKIKKDSELLNKISE